MNAADKLCQDTTLPRRLRSGASVLASLLLFALFAAQPAIASPQRPVAPPSKAATGKSSPGGFFLVVADKDIPVPPGKVRIEVQTDRKFYRATLPKTIPETSAPARIRDTFPADGIKVQLYRLKDDGLIFSWITSEMTFDESILFAGNYESMDENKVMTWSKLQPGLYAFVEQSLMGVGDTCFVFRIIP